MIIFEKYILKNSKNLIICLKNSRSWDLNTDIFRKYEKVYVFEIRDLKDYENLIHGFEGDYLIDIRIDEYLKNRIKTNNR